MIEERPAHCGRHHPLGRWRHKEASRVWVSPWTSLWALFLHGFRLSSCHYFLQWWTMTWKSKLHDSCAHLCCYWPEYFIRIMEMKVELRGGVRGRIIKATKRRNGNKKWIMVPKNGSGLKERLKLPLPPWFSLKGTARAGRTCEPEVLSKLATAVSKNIQLKS